MKKLNSLVLITLVTVSLVNCIDPANIQATDKLSLAEIYEDDFGSNVLDLLSIHSMAGESMDALYEVLDEIRDHLDRESTQDRDQWGQESAALQVIVRENTQQYETSAGQVVAFNELLETTRQQLGMLSDQLDTLNDNRADISRRIETHDAMIVSETAAFEQRQADDTSSINAIDEALEILGRFPDLNEQSASFIEINNKQLSKVQNTLQSKARRENNVYLPLISALTSLVQTSTVTPRTVLEIIDLLEQLRKSVVESQASDLANHRINLGIWTQTSEDMANQLKTTNDNIDTTTYQVQNTRSLIEDTVRFRDAEIVIRDNCQETFTTTQNTIDQKQDQFDDRELIRAAQLILLDQLQGHVEGDMQGFHDEIEVLF